MLYMGLSNGRTQVLGGSTDPMRTMPRSRLPAIAPIPAVSYSPALR